MNILFKSKKWDKEKDEAIRNRNEFYSHNNVSNNIPIEEININNYIKGYLSGNGLIKDLNSLYYQIGNQYYFMAISDWLMFNDAQKSAIDLYLYLLSKKKSYDLMHNGEKSKNPSIQRAMHNGRDYKLMMCTAIALDQFELIQAYKDYCPIITFIYQQNNERAKELVERIPESVDNSREVYYIEDKFLKKIYLAILHKDEAMFNEELVNRIKKLRKNMVGYLTIIDIISISMIKLGNKQGLNCNFNVIEIPEYFVNSDGIDFTKYKLPDIK